MIVLYVLIALVGALCLQGFLTWLESRNGSWATTVTEQRRRYIEDLEDQHS